MTHLFVALPLKIEGATGSMLDPVVIVFARGPGIREARLPFGRPHATVVAPATGRGARCGPTRSTDWAGSRG